MQLDRSTFKSCALRTPADRERPPLSETPRICFNGSVEWNLERQLSDGRQCLFREIEIPPNCVFGGGSVEEWLNASLGFKGGL